MSVSCSNLLCEAVQSGEIKFYSDERARNYLKTKLKDIMPEDKLNNVMNYFEKLLYNVTFQVKQTKTNLSKTKRIYQAKHLI